MVDDKKAAVLAAFFMSDKSIAAVGADTIAAVRWLEAEISMRTKSPARWETSGAEMASQGEHSYKVTPHASTPLIRVTRWSPSRPFLGGPATKSWMGAPAALCAVSRSIESNHGTAHHSPLPDFSTGGADPIAAFRSETRGQEALREPDVPFLHAAALPQPQNRQLLGDKESE
jgi:hypothetical protein